VEEKQIMIDDYEDTMELIEQMKAHVPISVYPGNAFIRMMREKGIRIKSKHQLQIEQVFYAGDDGGIMCGLRGIGDGETAYVVSLTHIKVKERHPLARAIKRYQRERRKALAQQALMEQVQSLVTSREQNNQENR
jgi:hypothetical protein